MNKRIFITGGAHGIGRGLVEAFCRQNDIVAFCDIDEQRGEETAKKYGAKFFCVDVTDKETLERCMLNLFKEWADIDVIINNVGIGNFKPITEVSVEEFDKVIQTNLRSAFITSRMLAIHRKQNGNKEYGRIINLCSSRYLMSEAGTEAYSASKGGIFSLTHALCVSLAPFNITVNAIAPGWIHVDENEILRVEDHIFHPSGRVGTVEDIANAALFICDEKNNFINGQTITIDGGVTRKMIYPE
ncbi:MAG: SDR family oxidoreductase [Bacteroidales bacterium]|nr:SDR family oxidoreductase [Bacteroidales bacterium]